MPHRSEPAFLVLHGLRLKGFALPEAMVPAARLEATEISHLLTGLHHEGFVTFREGRVAGWSLTAAGRAEHARSVREELRDAGVEADIDKCYRRFLDLNGELLATATAWQIRDL